MDITDTVIISRHWHNIYYIIIGIWALITIYYIYRTDNKRFLSILWAVSALICLSWELALYLLYNRTYTFGILELAYHGMTEASIPIIWTVILLNRLKLIQGGVK